MSDVPWDGVTERREENGKLLAAFARLDERVSNFISRFDAHLERFDDHTKKDEAEQEKITVRLDEINGFRLKLAGGLAVIAATCTFLGNLIARWMMK